MNAMRTRGWRRMAGLATVVLIGTLIGATTAAAKDPYARPDDSWISISGTVDSVTRDAFVLDYGDGVITVEMDDGDRDADAYALLEGDKVTVYGAIDDDFYEATTIEAARVYVEKINTYFYASAVDEEDAWVYMGGPVIVSSTVLQGTVTDVNGDETFILDDGVRALTVDVDEMPYNPLDDEGYQMIEEGDRVSVTGQMEVDVFNNRRFEARSIVTLQD